MTATDPLALEGRDGRPLTAVTHIDLEPSTFLLDEVAGHIGNAISGVIVAGRQADPELREPLAHLARVSGFPILAEPTSQLRCGPARSLACRRRLRPAAARRALRPLGRARPDPPLRRDADQQAAARLDRGQRRRPDRCRPLRRLERADRRAAAILRADPTELAQGWAARLEGLEGRERSLPERWLEAESAAQAALDEALATGGPITEPALHRALGAAHRDGDLVYTSSSMPIRDQEAFLAAGGADVFFLSNRGANGIDGLVSSGIGAAQASGRPTTIITGDLGFLHDLGGLAALREVETPVRIVVIDNDGGGIFHFLPQEQALAGEEFEALLGTPRGIDVAKAAALFDLPHQRLESLADLPETLAAGTGLIEVKADRQTNVEAHRALQAAVRTAISS